MPRDMFGDVVEAVDQGRDQAVVHGAAVDSGPRRGAWRAHRHSADGDRHAADAAVDDGVCGACRRPRRRHRRRPRRRRRRRRRSRCVQVNPNAAPVEAPKEIKPEPPRPPSFSMGGVVGGVAGGIPGGVAGWRRRRHSAAAAPAAARRRRCASAATSRSRRSSTTCSRSIRRSRRRPRSRASSSSRPTIGKDGSVKDAKVLRPAAAARPGGARRRQAVEVHADPAERRAGGSRLDRHGELHS